jgi:hypothetical protein
MVVNILNQKLEIGPITNLQQHEGQWNARKIFSEIHGRAIFVRFQRSNNQQGGREQPTTSLLSTYKILTYGRGRGSEQLRISEEKKCELFVLWDSQRFSAAAAMRRLSDVKFTVC